MRRRRHKEEEEKRVVASWHDTVKYENSPRAEQKKKVDKLKITARERFPCLASRADFSLPGRPITPQVTVEIIYKPTRGRFVPEQIPKRHKLLQLG